ncbi:acyl carrier protein [Streptomyces sp. YGL11-2]|uniref:acyl carrier protein n=1 Tax=Streptomyces sp. YGL11-2 TaxID=3414028 RepID=UPI003CEFC71F
MTTNEFTLDDLKRILRQVAGVDEAFGLDGDILDSDFEQLGYESLALLETGSCIEREYGIALDDTAVSGTATPRELINAVNGLLAAA